MIDLRDFHQAGWLDISDNPQWSQGEMNPILELSLSGDFSIQERKFRISIYSKILFIFNIL